MKRLSTSLLIFILALLAVPDRAWAWSDLRLRSSIYNNWDTSYSSGTPDESSFNKVDNNVNKWTKTIDATSIKEDIVFRLYTTDNGGKEVQPSVDNTDITNKGVYSSTEFVQGKGDKSFRLLQSTNHYDTYTIDAEYTDNKWNITVTATKSGSSDPVSTYKLMNGDGTNKGTQVATFTGTNFPYTATYNIDAAGTYYFYVNDGSKDYLNANQAFSDGTKITLYQYGTSNYRHAIKLEATTTGTYTFTFAQETSDYSITCTYPTSTGEDTYNLVYLVDKTLKGKLHTWLEGGATDVDITSWGNRPTIGSGDFPTTTKYNNTDYYTKTFSVNKTTADSYKQIGVKIGDNGANLTSNVITSTWNNVQYIIVTSSGVNIVENTATLYTVTVSSADANMGTVSPTSVSVNATTSQKVTATPNSGYKFVNWTATGGAKVASESSATTTVTATQAGTLIANFQAKSTPTPTPILGNNFYLVGDFLNTDDGINYDCRYFKLSETAAATAARDGVEEYSINIPTTLAVNVQILATDEDGSTALYGPSGEVTINKNNPSGSGSTTGALVAASKTLTNYFKFEDRTTGRTTETPNENDGLYTITVTVTNGVPTNYTIEHNPLTRVAYYLPNTSDASVKESLNTRSQTTAAFNNVFFGRVYLPANVACYVLSNYLGAYDYSTNTDTKTKLYLQGNRSGGNPDTQEGERNDYTKVYPIIDNNGTPTGAQPFVFSTTEIVAMNLEYAPRRGHGDYKAEGITGEVLRSQKTTQAEDGSSITVPTIQVLKMVGPAVGDDTWNYNNGVVMNYNMAEQCWEATINTSAKAGAKFRFVANNTWENSWQENGTAEADKARIPYNVDGVGHAATPADPNEVSYISLTQDQVRDEKYDIIFNRDPGTWRVRFYFTSQQIDENNYKYVFKYTINGYKSVLRTYCSNRDEKPTDESIKIYGAYAFEGNETDNSGKIKLYEMNYIPANEGVILYSANVIDEATIAAYTPEAGETKYKNIPDTKDKYHNYLVGTLVNTTVNASVFDGKNVRTHRNFFFNYFSKSGCYTDGTTDYLGFFRIKSGSTCIANHAYLSLPTDVLAWNGQTFGQVMDEYEAKGDQHASLSKGMRIVFSDGSDWVEDVPTSITTIKDKNRVFDNYYYTLQGVRVEKPLKGIYIHNGKKVVIK